MIMKALYIVGFIFTSIYASTQDRRRTFAMAPPTPDSNATSPFPPTMNLRKFCEQIRNPNMCLMSNGCQWKPITMECSQLNCEKIFGWMNCAKSAGCMYTPDDQKCNDQSEAGPMPFAGLNFGPGAQGPEVTGFSPQAFGNPAMFNLPDYTNPVNGDSMPGYYNGFEPEMPEQPEGLMPHPAFGQGQIPFGEYESPFEAFEMEDVFKNPVMYHSMMKYFNQYMSTKFTICADLTDPAQCSVEGACMMSGGSCVQNTFGVPAAYHFVSKPQEHSESPQQDDKQPVAFYIGLGFAGVVIGFLSAVGLQTLCCEKRQENVGLDQYLRQNV